MYDVQPHVHIHTYVYIRNVYINTFTYLYISTHTYIHVYLCIYVHLYLFKISNIVQYKHKILHKITAEGKELSQE